MIKKKQPLVLLTLIVVGVGFVLLVKPLSHQTPDAAAPQASAEPVATTGGEQAPNIPASAIQTSIDTTLKGVNAPKPAGGDGLKGVVAKPGGDKNSGKAAPSGPVKPVPTDTMTQSNWYSPDSGHVTTK